MRNISFMIALSVSFAEGAVRGNAEMETLLVVSRSWYRLCHSRKTPLSLLLKDEA